MEKHLIDIEVFPNFYFLGIKDFTTKEITSYEVIEAPKVVIYIHPGNRVVAMVGLSSASAPAESVPELHRCSMHAGPTGRPVHPRPARFR